MWAPSLLPWSLACSRSAVLQSRFLLFTLSPSFRLLSPSCRQLFRVTDYKIFPSIFRSIFPVSPSRNFVSISVLSLIMSPYCTVMKLLVFIRDKVTIWVLVRPTVCPSIPRSVRRFVGPLVTTYSFRPTRIGLCRVKGLVNCGQGN